MGIAVSDLWWREFLSRVKRSKMFVAYSVCGFVNTRDEEALKEN
jgi:hypothetical protein